jgi:23S rRNA (uracil1939-C5)-methyltransferase
MVTIKANDATIWYLNYKGRDYILEEMEGLKFSINAKSFYQTNSDQAYELYKITRDACLTGNEIVYDLYKREPLLSLFLKRQKK